MPHSRKDKIIAWWLCLILGCLLAVVIYRGVAALISDIPFTFGQWDRDFRKGLPEEVRDAMAEPVVIGFLVLVLLAFLTAFVRSTQFPAWAERHRQWLATTPWTPKEPLPFGPCTPTWRDLCAMAALEGLLWWHVPALPGLIITIYLYTWVILNLLLLNSCHAKLCLGIAIVLALPLWLPIKLSVVLLCGVLAALLMRLFGIPVLLRALFKQDRHLLSTIKSSEKKKDRLGSFTTLSPKPEDSAQDWLPISALAIFASGGFSHTSIAIEDKGDLSWLVPFLFVGIVIYRWITHLLVKWPIPTLHKYFRVSGLIGFVVFGLCYLAPAEFRPLWSTPISLLGLVLLARVEDLRRWTLTGPGRLHFHSDASTHVQI